MDTNKIKSKILLQLPLTTQEYAYAVLYMGLPPDAYKKASEIEQTQQHKSQQDINIHLNINLKTN